MGAAPGHPQLSTQVRPTARQTATPRPPPPSASSCPLSLRRPSCRPSPGRCPPPPPHSGLSPHPRRPFAYPAAQVYHCADLRSDLCRGARGERHSQAHVARALMRRQQGRVEELLSLVSQACRSQRQVHATAARLAVRGTAPFEARAPHNRHARPPQTPLRHAPPRPRAESARLEARHVRAAGGRLSGHAARELATATAPLRDAGRQRRRKPGVLGGAPGRDGLDAARPDLLDACAHDQATRRVG